MRVVLDTNVLVSAIHLRSRVAREVLASMLAGDHHLLTGSAVLAELEGVLVDTFQWNSDAARATRLQVEQMAQVVHVESVTRVCRDPDDDEVLAVAASGEADMLVTGDKDLLILGEHAGTRIVTPRQFLDATAEKESGPVR